MTDIPTAEEILRVQHYEREQECKRYGHYIDVVSTVASPEPVKFVCSNCGLSWLPCTHSGSVAEVKSEVVDPWADGKQPEGYEPCPGVPGVYRSTPKPSLWQRIRPRTKS